jgi:IclR family acetate operon transcriptional repressor
MAGGSQRQSSLDGSRQAILVLRKVSRILDCFSEDAPALSLQRIREMTGLPASTCQRLLRNLAGEGFLDRDGDQYRIGLRLVAWSAPGTLGLDIVKASQPVLDRLRDSTTETCCLYVRDGLVRTCVAIAGARHPVIRQLYVGKVLPLHAGSPGKVFLAYDPALTRAVCEEGLRRYTEHTIVSAGELAASLEQVRRDGYAATFQETEAGAGSVSAPVFGRDGEVLAAISAAAPVQRLTDADVPRLAPLVMAAADDLSRRMGGHPPAATGPGLAGQQARSHP